VAALAHVAELFAVGVELAVWVGVRAAVAVAEAEWWDPV
jgi:hypothetical protein